MQGPPRQTPLYLLGQRLRQIREKRQESLAEASGAVEIDIDTLERIENGEERPCEEVLMLLINHFCVHEHEAVELWAWAGYDQAGDSSKSRQPVDGQVRAALALVVLDVRAVYSDGLMLTHNDSGIILNFTQSVGAQQVQPVARVGMSYEQAALVLQQLQQALLRNAYLPKRSLLPPGELPE